MGLWRHNHLPLVLYHIFFLFVACISFKASRKTAKPFSSYKSQWVSALAQKMSSVVFGILSKWNKRKNWEKIRFLFGNFSIIGQRAARANKKSIFFSHRQREISFIFVGKLNDSLCAVFSEFRHFFYALQFSSFHLLLYNRNEFESIIFFRFSIPNLSKHCYASVCRSFTTNYDVKTKVKNNKDILMIFLILAVIWFQFVSFSLPPQFTCIVFAHIHMLRTPFIVIVSEH